VLALVAVVLAAVVGGLALFVSWPDDPTAPHRDTAGGVLRVDQPSADSTAVSTATAVLQAWSRKGLTYAWWWDGLRPLLSPGARTAYAGTDTDQLPTLGTLEVVEEREAPTNATVWFRTDAGRFGVDLARTTADDPWRAHRILFPGEESMFG
jgi:hypothetical protein